MNFLNYLHLQVIQAVLRHVNFEVVKAVLIASPGFVRQQFFDYMYQQASVMVMMSVLMKVVMINRLCLVLQAVKTDNKLLFENKSKFLLVHASSGFKHSLKEVGVDS